MTGPIKMISWFRTRASTISGGSMGFQNILWWGGQDYPPVNAEPKTSVFTVFFGSENVKNRASTAYLTFFGGLQKPPI